LTELGALLSSVSAHLCFFFLIVTTFFPVLLSPQPHTRRIRSSLFLDNVVATSPHSRLIVLSLSVPSFAISWRLLPPPPEHFSMVPAPQILWSRRISVMAGPFRVLNKLELFPMIGGNFDCCGEVFRVRDLVPRRTFGGLPFLYLGGIFNTGSL